MKPELLSMLLVTGLFAGCASSTTESLPVCDGKQRRTANPYGSVLSADLAPQGRSPDASPQPCKGARS